MRKHVQTPSPCCSMDLYVAQAADQHFVTFAVVAALDSSDLRMRRQAIYATIGQKVQSR